MSSITVLFYIVILDQILLLSYLATYFALENCYYLSMKISIDRDVAKLCDIYCAKRGVTLFSSWSRGHHVLVLV